MILPAWEPFALHKLRLTTQVPTRLVYLISQRFAISETYLGRYFKKHFNETYQQYIMQYKFKLIENRLLHSNMRINEIADEFGFTDKSHFNRMFKKHSGMSPSAFKKPAKEGSL
ncbi:helix-turn-helix domain-containing protein [Flavitalea flava]